MVEGISTLLAELARRVVHNKPRLPPCMARILALGRREDSEIGRVHILRFENAHEKTVGFVSLELTTFTNKVWCICFDIE